MSESLVHSGSAEVVLLDTNIVVRFLLWDVPTHGAIAKSLFEACDRGELRLELLPVVLAEVVFVLESFYEIPRPQIAKQLMLLIQIPGLMIDNSPIHLEALARYSLSGLHFVDCVLAATAVSRDVRLATFDKGLRKLKDVKKFDMSFKT